MSRVFLAAVVLTATLLTGSIGSQDAPRGREIDKLIATYLEAGCGFGGSCFPKDTRALVHTAEEHGADVRVVSAVIESVS